MPQDEDTLNNESPVLDETEGTPEEPKKVTVPGLEGEFTPEQIQAWKEDSENKSAWSRELHEKGTRLNEREREIADRIDEQEAKLQDIERRFSERPQVQIQPAPEKSWRDYETPEEQTRAFFEQQEREGKITRQQMEEKINKLESELSAQREEQKQEKTSQYWTNISEEALDKYAGDDPDVRDFIEGRMIKYLAPQAKYWKPEMFFEEAKRGKEIFENKMGKSVKEWAKGKKKGAEQTKPLSGQTPAPKVGERPKRSETKLDRMRRMAKDPNIAGWGEG